MMKCVRLGCTQEEAAQISIVDARQSRPGLWPDSLAQALSQSLAHIRYSPRPVQSRIEHSWSRGHDEINVLIMQLPVHTGTSLLESEPTASPSPPMDKYTSCNYRAGIRKVWE